MKLVIVESPTKARTIQKFLGKFFVVKSSYGHIRDLPKNELGIDVENDFKPRYVVPLKAKKIVSELKKIASRAKIVILATDEDREGEAIAWHIAQTLNLGDYFAGKEIKNKKEKPYQRIVFHEITEGAIKQALENPRPINFDLVNAQQARRILDRLVGYELSPFLWKKVAKGLSAGRVQSVAVRLIVEREDEIKSFKPEEYWTIEAELAPPKSQRIFLAKLIKKNNRALPKLGIKNKETVEKIIKQLRKTQFQVKRINSKKINRNPLPPFTTSTLQQTASNWFGFSAKQTMRLAQQLYEGINLGDKGRVGLITYMRTDSLNLSNSALADIRQVIDKKYGKKFLAVQTRIYKTKNKGVQEAHEAIRPTQPFLAPDDIRQYLDNKQFKLYQLIWQRTIACQMSPAVLETTVVDVQAGQYIFRATGNRIQFEGFLRVYPIKITEAFLPDLEKNQILSLIDLKSYQHFTQPLARYSEASLIKALEKEGIGRPSTYAPIISTIQERNYVFKNEQKRFQPTEMGVLVTGILVKHFPQIVDVKFTARIEEKLDKIALGKLKWISVIRDFYSPFKDNLNKKYKEINKKELTEEKTTRKCPQCGSDLIIKLGRYGKFYACSNFPKCKYTEPLKSPNINVPCPKCLEGEILERHTKKGKLFYSCSRYPKCDYASWDKPTGQRCPKCGHPLVEKGKKIKCSNKDCDYSEDKS